MGPFCLIRDVGVEGRYGSVGYLPPAGGLVSPSDFSTVMGNHLLAVAPLGRRVPISIQVLPVHLSSRIEPRLPPPVALVIATVKHSSALAGNANIAKQTDNSIVFMSLLLAKGAV